MRKDVRQLKTLGGLLLCVAIFLMLLLIMAADGKTADTPADYPSKPIQFNNSTSPGSGLDIMCRLMSDIVQKEKILNQPMVVVNKPGSSGAVAFGYLLEKKGNPYVILASGTGSIITTPLVENLPYTYKSFTPIANLIFEGVLLVVKTDSSFNTIDDIIAEARKKPKKLIQGGASFTSNESVMGQSIQKLKGVQWNFISFKSDNETMLNVLSGNVDFAFTNPSFMLDFARAGKLRVLLADAPYRYPEFKDVPTVREAGMGEPVVVYRGIMGPPNMPDYAVRKMEAAFKKVMDSDRFKKSLQNSMTPPFWMSSQEYSKFLDEENERCKARLATIDLLKKK
jgi:putative tricarboxylic transport membrane protein